MTTMYRSSSDVTIWVVLMVAIVLVVALLAGIVDGVEVSAPSIGFEPPGAPEQISSEAPAYLQEMAVYGETGGAAADIMPVYLVEEQVAGG